MNAAKKQYRLAELVSGLEVTIKGDPECLISGVSTIQQAQPGHITFLTNALYRKHLADTKASAVIITEADAQECATNAVLTRNPHFIYAKIAEYFDNVPKAISGIHPSAIIGEHCHIDPTASIGANCVINDHVTIGENVQIGANCSIGEGVQIGDSSRLDANVTIYHHVKIGQRAHIKSGAVIGSDGFGFANQRGAWCRVPQLGTVIIGDDVDVGANTSIDRGAVEDTVIENGVKLDNLIQVGHNVHIGANTIVAGCVAIAGSTIIGKNCMIGGASCFAGHISIADGVIVTGMTAVTKSITEPGMYSSGIVGAVPNLEFRKNNARFHRLEQLMQRVKNIETALKESERNV